MAPLSEKLGGYLHKAKGLLRRKKTVMKQSLSPEPGEPIMWETRWPPRSSSLPQPSPVHIRPYLDGFFPDAQQTPSKPKVQIRRYKVMKGKTVLKDDRDDIASGFGNPSDADDEDDEDESDTGASVATNPFLDGEETDSDVLRMSDAYEEPVYLQYPPPQARERAPRSLLCDNCDQVGHGWMDCLEVCKACGNVNHQLPICTKQGDGKKAVKTRQGEGADTENHEARLGGFSGR